MASEDVTTIREVIDMLTDLASFLPVGPDTQVEFGICDGENLQMVDKVDVSHYTHVRDDGSDQIFVIIRGHVHLGEKPGRLLRGAVADVDQELHDLLDGDDG